MLAKAYGNPYWTGAGVGMGILARKGFGALGDDTTGDTTGVQDYCSMFPDACSGGGGGGFTPNVPATPASPFPWANVAGIANTFSADFSTIFKAVRPIPAGCTQVAGPYGSSVSCAQPGQPGAALTLLSGGSASYMPMLLLAGAGLLAFKVFAK